ncbi:uncharacterized protein LOC126188062 [Schistocerca cancellata]|uniref:uncharacterized protein LOC126188062 n=1 Tax=Schistocerca cancellata TaxID=274614 RepID=UPI002117596E|nr:uncharacterized protein LOC126188062 [Schistocerca cancellata]
MPGAVLRCKQLASVRRLCYCKPIHVGKFLKQYSTPSSARLETLIKPELDVDYLCNADNKTEIEHNIRNRKGVGNINRVLELHKRISSLSPDREDEMQELRKEFEEEALLIPNKSFPSLSQYGEEPKVLNFQGVKPSFPFKAKEFSEITIQNRTLRTENLAIFTGHRGYCFSGQLAELEQALVRYTVRELLSRNFKLISVPDILPREVIEGCGMNTRGERTQVFSLDAQLHGEDLCLSGTSEMALAGYLANAVFEESALPEKLAAVSRCYRAETSSIAEERGIYRVHQFTKVEMFAVTNQTSSAELMSEFCHLQEHLFSSLGLHTRTLDMPPHELGAAAYRKHDIEAWMPGRNAWGEISSCSNCTDYQTRRLNVRYKPTGVPDCTIHAHTVNGTACAVPRMLIAIIETHQQHDGTVIIPEPLQPFMRGSTCIGKQDLIPAMQFIRKRELTEKG